ncbi:MAG TPA: hypothetical protein VFK89_11115 [Actinomycetota bacterium]|nr:hypothetical protein [Actinomycetota bacterium]
MLGGTTKITSLLMATTLLLASCTGSGKNDAATGVEELSPEQARSALTDQLETPVTAPGNDAVAAKSLAAQAEDPDVGPAAVMEILSRAGIAVLSSSDGAILNRPAEPTFIDLYVYDFQVPMLAQSLADHETMPFEDFANLVSLMKVGVTESKLLSSLHEWMKSGTAKPYGKLSFHVLETRELGKLHEPAADPATSSDPDIDYLQMVLMAASLMSRTGKLSSIETASAFAGDTRVAQTKCREPSGDDGYDSGLFDETKKRLWNQAANVAAGEHGEKAGEAAGAAQDVYEILTSGIAVGLLLAGLHIKVENDTGGKPVHYRHNRAPAANNMAKFTATVSFYSPLPGVSVECGILRGLKLPANNGPRAGFKVQWDLPGTSHVETAPGSSGKLKRGGGGGEITKDDGQSIFEVQTLEESACKKDLGTCGKGQVVKGRQYVKAEVDLTTDPPIKLADLIFEGDLESSTSNLIKAAYNVLLDVIKEIGAPSATDSVAVEFHGGDYKIEYAKNGMRFTGKKCDGPAGHWDIDVSGQLGASGSLPLSLDGHIDIEIDDADLGGPATGHIELQTVGGSFFFGALNFDFTGDAQFEFHGDFAKMRVTNVKATGRATGSAGGTSISKALAGEGGGGLPLPVQVGTFCSGGD